MRNKKRAAALLVLAGTLAAYLTVHSVTAITASTPSFEQFEQTPTIVIDAGHGESNRTKKQSGNRRSVFIISGVKLGGPEEKEEIPVRFCRRHRIPFCFLL